MSLPGLVAVAQTVTGLFDGGGSTAAYSWNPRGLGLAEGPGFNAVSWPKPWVNNTRQTIAVRVSDFEGFVLPGQVIYQGNGTKPYMGAAPGGTTDPGLPVTTTEASRYSWNPRALGLTEGAGYSALSWPKPWTNVTGRTLSLVLAGTTYTIPHGTTIMQENGKAPYLAAGTGGTATTPAGNTSVTVASDTIPGAAASKVSRASPIAVLAVLGALYFALKE